MDRTSIPIRPDEIDGAPPEGLARAARPAPEPSAREAAPAGDPAAPTPLESYNARIEAIVSDGDTQLEGRVGPEALAALARCVLDELSVRDRVCAARIDALGLTVANLAAKPDVSVNIDRVVLPKTTIDAGQVEVTSAAPICAPAPADPPGEPAGAGPAEGRGAEGAAPAPARRAPSPRHRAPLTPSRPVAVAALVLAVAAGLVVAALAALSMLRAG